MPRSRRVPGERRTKPIFVIACEDSVSAPAYFRALGRQVAQHVVLRIVKRRPNETLPDQVLQRALDERRDVSEGNILDQTWIVVDVDPHAGAGRDDKLRKAVLACAKGGVNAAVSNPCFEHWLRLHMELCDGGYGRCKDVVDHLKQLWRARFGRDYRKGDQAAMATLITSDLQTAAVANAKHQHLGDKRGTPPHECPPCVCDVYRLIDAVNEIGRSS